MKFTTKFYGAGDVLLGSFDRYEFSEETKLKLKQIGIYPTHNKGQYANSTVTILVYDYNPYPIVQISKSIRSRPSKQEVTELLNLVNKIFEIIEPEYDFNKEGEEINDRTKETD